MQVATSPGGSTQNLVSHGSTGGRTWFALQGDLFPRSDGPASGLTCKFVAFAIVPEVFGAMELELRRLTRDSRWIGIVAAALACIFSDACRWRSDLLDSFDLVIECPFDELDESGMVQSEPEDTLSGGNLQRD